MGLILALILCANLVILGLRNCELICKYKLKSIDTWQKFKPVQYFFGLFDWLFGWLTHKNLDMADAYLEAELVETKAEIYD